jgi:hypothetical protein
MKLTIQRLIPFVALFIIALLTRLTMIDVYDNYVNGDATARLSNAYHWFLSPHNITHHIDWLPLYRVIMGATFFIWDEPIYGPRFFTLIFSLITLIPLYFSLEKFFNRTVALSGGLLFAISGTHCLLGTITLTNALFELFLISSLWALTRAQGSFSWRSLVSLVVLLSAMNYMRYEGWIVSAVSIGLLVYLNCPRTKTIIFAIGACLVPTFVMWKAYQIFGDPLRGLTYSDLEVKGYLQTLQPTLSFKLEKASKAYILPLLFMSFPGLVYGLKDKISSSYIILYSILSTALLCKLLNGTLNPDPRYFSSVALMSGALGLFAIYEILPQKLKKGLPLMALALGLPSFLTVHETGLQARQGRIDDYAIYPPGFYDSVNWAKKNLSQKNHVLLDWSEHSEWAWVVYSGGYIKDNVHSKSQSRIKEKFSVDCVFTNRFWVNDISDQSFVSDCLQRGNIDTIVFLKDGPLRKYLNFENEIESFGQIRFNRVFLKNGYVIYSKLSRP